MEPAGIKHDMRLGTSRKQILQLALPISASILVPQINFITNNIFLGRLGETELGVAGITGVYYLIFGAIGYGLNNGLQALIARRAGENKPEEIGRLFSQGVRVAMIIATIGILVTWFIAPAILEFALKDPLKRNMVIHFLKIRVWGLPFLYLYQMRNALLVGTNQSKYLVIGTLAETITNIVIDYGLIFGKLGLPRMGFNGAAIASIIAEATGMFVVFAVIHWKGLSHRFHLYKSLGYHRDTARLVVVQSSPLIFQYAISIISWEFFFIMIERNSLHSYDLAISNMMRNIFGLFGVSTWAFAATSSTMVSNLIGQKRHDEVHGLIMKIVQLCTGAAIVVCLSLNLFPLFFMKIFGQEQQLIISAVPVLRVVGLAFVLMSVGIVWLNAVIGTGNTKMNFLIELVAVILYSIYVFTVMEVFHLSITIGWASEWLYWSVIFCLSFTYMKSGKWKSKTI
jgi:MATE family multidrug resistance protein